MNRTRLDLDDASPILLALRAANDATANRTSDRETNLYLQRARSIDRTYMKGSR